MAKLGYDDVHFTVLVRLPFARGDFVDPHPVGCERIRCSFGMLTGCQSEWTSEKDRELWEILSRSSAKAQDLDCKLIKTRNIPVFAEIHKGTHCTCCERFRDPNSADC